MIDQDDDDSRLPYRTIKIARLCTISVVLILLHEQTFLFVLLTLLQLK